MNQFVKSPDAAPELYGVPQRLPWRNPREDDEESLDIRRIILPIWRRKWLILLAMILGAAIAVLVAVNSEERYTSSARVIFEPERVQIIDLDNVLVAPDTSTTGLQNQIEILRSARLLQRVIDILRLESYPEFNPALETSPPILERIISRLNLPRPVVNQLADFGLVSHLESEDLSEEQRLERRRARTLDIINRNLRLRPLPNTRVIEISFTSRDPVLAATIANTIGEQYIVVQAERKRDEITAASETLSVRVRDLENRLNAAEEAVRIAELELSLNSEYGPTLIARQLELLNERLTEARLTRSNLETRHDRVTAALEDEESFGVVPEFRDSEIISEARAKERALLEELASLRSIVARDQSPEVKQINARLDEVRRTVRLEAGNIAEALGIELAAAREREAALEADLDTLESQALEHSRAEMRLNRLEREAQASRMIYETFLNRLQEAREQANLQTPDASFLTRATIPPAADIFSRIGLLIIGPFGGAALGVGLVFLLEMLNSSFREPNDLEEATSLPVLAAIPSAGRRKSPRALVDHVLKKPNSSLAEAVRNLRTSIFFSRLDCPPRTVMFASSVPGEGKTSIAALMAVTSLQVNRSAVIVDCDLRRQTLSKMFAGSAPKKGLVSLLEGNASLDEAIHVEPSSGIHVLASETGGRLPGNPADILASRRFQRLVEQLKARYDLVIFDTPPALVVTDARILAQAVDSVVYLIQWNRTARGAVLHGLRELASVEAKVTGVALTLVDEARAANHVNAEYLSKRRYRKYVSS